MDEELHSKISTLANAFVASKLSELPASLSVQEAAAVMRIGVNKTYELTRRRGFPAIRDGWKIRIPTHALFRWMEEEAFRNTGAAAIRD